VAWLWHCHRLAPSKYEAYVTRRFGLVIEASPPFAVQQPAPTDNCGDSEVDYDARVTRQMWHARYPDRPFFLPVETRRGSSDLTSQECRGALHGYDLLASTVSQATFLWQVSRPQYFDEAFLRQGVERYHKFLKLATFTGKDGVLVPTYQVQGADRRAIAAHTSLSCR
jgi:Glycine-rich domain-containing protein-like